MSLVNQTTPPNYGAPDNPYQTSSTKDMAVQVRGEFTGNENTEYIVRVDELTEGVTSVMYRTPAVAGPGTGLTTGIYENLATTNVSSSGSGLTLSIEIKGGTFDPASEEFLIDTGGTGYEGEDTIKVAGNLIGGATPANDLTLKIKRVQNLNLKYRYKTIVDNEDQGWVPVSGNPTTAIQNHTQGQSIGNGLILSWGSFSPFVLGEEINFMYNARGTVSSDMHVLNTKDGAHILKFFQGILTVHHNIDTAVEIDPNNVEPSIGDKERAGILSRQSDRADFQQLNSKSVAVGLGPDSGTPPKWAGMQQYKQWDRDFNDSKIIIEDAELKIPTEIPILDDLCKLTTDNWYNAAGDKAGDASAWDVDFWAGFKFGDPNIYVFRTETIIAGITNKVHQYYKYGIEDTNITSPISIASDGPNLFVLDDVGAGLIHCFKFTGLEDSSNTNCPTIAKFEKYNSNWPYPLPDTAPGICTRRFKPEVQGGGAWFSQILVTPTDSRFNTGSGGEGRIWLQASWQFNADRDYAPYIQNPDGFDPDGTMTLQEKAWYPPICGETFDQEWLWSVELANPAHPTGMAPAINSSSRLLLINRSPSMTKFYKVNSITFNGPDQSDENDHSEEMYHHMIIRGDYDITVGGHPQGTEGTAANENSFETPDALVYPSSGSPEACDLVSNGGLAQPLGPKEAGVLQTFVNGMTDIGEAKWIGVSCVYAPSDSGWCGTYAPFYHPGQHLLNTSVLWSELISSSCYYTDSFLNAGNGSIYVGNRDRLIFASGATGLPKEVEVCGLPASQVVSFNIIDGDNDGFAEKPLIIPLGEDALHGGGYNAPELPTTFEASTWGTQNYQVNEYLYNIGDGASGRKLVGPNGYPSRFRRAYMVDRGDTYKRWIYTYDHDGNIKNYEVEALYDANSLETSAGANSWKKDTFFRKNPFHKQNDNFYASVTGKAASELIPGAYAVDGASTNLVQHPRANGMNMGGEGTTGKMVAYRDATAFGSTRFTQFTGENAATWNSARFGEWEEAYGGKSGVVRVFTLQHEFSETAASKINYNDASPTTQWDFVPTSVMQGGDSGNIIVLNQRESQISYISFGGSAGVKAVDASHGFKPQVPYITITGHDDEGDGAPAEADDRIGSPVAPETSDFIGWFAKDTPADGGTDGALESPLAPQYMYYAFSFMFDGFQESPLSESIGSSVDSNSGWSVQTTGDCLNVKITIPNIDNISKRVSHINIYRSRSTEDVAFPKAFFQLVEQIPLDDTRWLSASTGSVEWSCSIVDQGKVGEQYETRTGMSEILENTQPHYGLSVEGDGYLFVTQAWHQSLDDNQNYIFRSKPGKYNMFDWSTDWLELPEYPTAISYYNGKLFAFSDRTTYMINPRTMSIEENILQCGCLGNDSVVSCDYGMFWADKESVWLYQGTSIQNIGLPIEQGGNFAYRERDRAKAGVFAEFDSLTKCFVLFIKPKKALGALIGNDVNSGELAETSYQGAVWSYHIEKKRWDYWILENALDTGEIGNITLATCRDWLGGVIYANKEGLYRLGADKKNRKNWQWISKNFVMQHPTLDKRFYKIRAVSQNGTPYIQYKVNDAAVGLGLSSSEKITTKKGKRIKVAVNANGETAVDSIGIIYRRPKAK